MNNEVVQEKIRAFWSLLIVHIVCVWMDGWVDGWMDRWMDGWMYDGWMDGWMLDG